MGNLAEIIQLYVAVLQLEQLEKANEASTAVMDVLVSKMKAALPTDGSTSGQASQSH